MKKMNNVFGIFYNELVDLYRRYADFTSYRNMIEGMQDQICYRKKYSFEERLSNIHFPYLFFNRRSAFYYNWGCHLRFRAEYLETAQAF